MASRSGPNRFFGEHSPLERMTADRLATLDEQLGWLRDAGFEDVRCAFESGRFAVYAGRRPA
jgi:hypothetical protein